MANEIVQFGIRPDRVSKCRTIPRYLYIIVTYDQKAGDVPIPTRIL